MSVEHHPVRHVNEQTPLPLVLLPPEVAQQLPKIGATQDQGLAALAQVRYYEPDTLRTWYAVESDGAGMFYGLVVEWKPKLTSFTLAELGKWRDGSEMPVERDVNFTPTSLDNLIAKYEAEMRAFEDMVLEQAWLNRHREQLEELPATFYDDHIWQA